MALGRRKAEPPRISADRLASIAGAAPAMAAETPAASAAPTARRSLEPDLRRIRPRGIEETPEQRKRRLAAKTINFSMTFLARTVILAAAAVFAWDLYQRTGMVHRGVAGLMLAVVADFGRVALKAMEPGTK